MPSETTTPIHHGLRARTRSGSRALLVAALIASLGAGQLYLPSIASAEGIDSLTEADRQRMLNLLQRGNEDFDRGAYPEALLSYETALKIAELASIHYRRGLCLEKLERYQEAVDAYKRFLQLDPSAREAGRVRADITRLEGIVTRQATGRLSVNTVPAGADVRIDDPNGPVLGSTPLLEVAVSPGDHTLFIDREGYQQKVERVDVRAGLAVVVSYSLEEIVANEGTVKVNSTPRGAVVRVGGEKGREIGKTPLSVTVGAGNVELYIAAEGYRPKSEKYLISAGQTLALDISLERQIPGMATNPGEGWKSEGPDTSEGSSIFGWGIGLTVTGVVLSAGAGGLWFLTESAIQDANDYERRSAGNTRDALEDMEAEVPLYKVSTYVTAGIGGVSLLTGIILMIAGSGGDEKPSVRLGLSPGGAQVGYEVEF